MSFKIICPSCQARLTAKSEKAVGKQLTCPKCSHAFVVPAPEGESVGDPLADPLATDADPLGLPPDLGATAPVQSPVKPSSGRGGQQLPVGLLAAGGGAIVVVLLLIVLLVVWFGGSNDADSAGGDVAAGETAAGDSPPAESDVLRQEYIDFMREFTRIDDLPEAARPGRLETLRENVDAMIASHQQADDRFLMLTPEEERELLRRQRLDDQDARLQRVKDEMSRLEWQPPRTDQARFNQMLDALNGGEIQPLRRELFLQIYEAELHQAHSAHNSN